MHYTLFNAAIILAVIVLMVAPNIVERYLGNKNPKH
jgi:TRAP-type C4-dicarboxylate transport system permease small subunit